MTAGRPSVIVVPLVAAMVQVVLSILLGAVDCEYLYVSKGDGGWLLRCVVGNECVLLDPTFTLTKFVLTF